MGSSIDIFMGKGGVGKTTFSAVYGLMSARENYKTLLLSLKSKKTLETYFGVNVHGTEVPLDSTGFLYSKELDPLALMNDIVKSSARVGMIANAIINWNPYKAFVEDFPITREGLLLREIYKAHAKGEYEALIVDAPATGHGISFLQAPLQLETILQGDLRDKNRELMELFTSKMTRIHLVTLAEEMPTNECIELYKKLNANKLNTVEVIVNKLEEKPPQLNDRQVQILHEKAPVISRAIEAASLRYKEQQHYLQRLKNEIPLPLQFYYKVRTDNKLQALTNQITDKENKSSQPSTFRLPRYNLRESIHDKNVLCYLGNGGVGKTTISAATALYLSEQKKVLVMTVDPARRLADSLGIKKLDSTAQLVPGTKQLYALMVDSKASLDEMIRQYAPQSQAEKIFSNKIYRMFSDSFTGLEDFIASGVLIEILKKKEYDTIIVDTAPSVQGIDFLCASEKVKRVFDSGLMKHLFQERKSFLQRALFSKVSKKIMSVFNHWTTDTFIEDVEEFIQGFSFLRPKLEDNAQQLSKILQNKKITAGAIVTSAESEVFEETLGIQEAMKKANVQLSYAIINKVRQQLSIPANIEEILQEVGEKTLGLYMENLHKDAISDAVGIERLFHTLNVPMVSVPEFENSIYSLQGLSRVSAQLFPDFQGNYQG